MSGRGANARKAVKKNIEKEEKKHDGDSTHRRPSSQGGWHIPAIKPKEGRSGRDTVSLRSARSKSGDENRSQRSASTHRTDKKQSAHPRGRGAGVSLVARTPTSTSSRYKSGGEPGTPGANSIFGSYGDEPAAAEWKIWSGNGQPNKIWPGFSKDHDMRMPSGDCTIRFGTYDESRNKYNKEWPVIRCHSEKLKQSHSSILALYVTQGQFKHSEDRSTFSTAESASQGSMSQELPKSPTELSNFSGTPELIAYNSNRSLRSDNSRRGEFLPREDTGSPTPMSRAQQGGSTLADSFNSQEAEITCDICVPIPRSLKTSAEVFAYKVSFRNFIAILYGKAIVGNNLFDMLKGLFQVSKLLHDSVHLKGIWHPAGVIIDYVLSKRIDDVRGNISNALSLLAWCEFVDTQVEEAGVYWEQGYTESLIHTVGMMTSRTSEMPEFRRLSTVTKHTLTKAFNVMQIKILDAEAKLGSFNFPEFLQLPNVIANSPAFRSLKSFSAFLKRVFEEKYSQWPPKKDDRGHWLTRDLVQEMQRDFGAIYDILVDRDIVWNDCEERATRRWQMTSKSSDVPLSTPDLPGLPIQDIMISFDNQHGYLHIPYPYPLIPNYSPPSASRQSKKKHIFGVLSKKDKSASTPDPSEQMKVALAFTEATNVSKIGIKLAANDLRDRFLEYEKACAPTLVDVPARDARVGRWILLYGVLQVLSTLSVDTLGMRYTDKATYFLCPPLDDVPPWPRDQGTRNYQAYKLEKQIKPANQQMSHCWTASKTWDPSVKTPSSAYQANTAELDDPGFISELDGRDITDDDHRARIAKIQASIISRNQDQAEDLRALQRPNLSEEEYRRLLEERERRERKLRIELERSEAQYHNLLARQERELQADQKPSPSLIEQCASILVEESRNFHKADKDHYYGSLPRSQFPFANNGNKNVVEPNHSASRKLSRQRVTNSLDRHFEAATQVWMNAVPATAPAPMSPLVQPQYDPGHYSPPLSPPPATPVPSLPAKSSLRNSSIRGRPLPQLDGPDDKVFIGHDKETLGARYRHLGFEEDDEETLPNYFAQ